MKAGKFKEPRRQPHLAAALDELAALGATDVSLTQKRHVRLAFALHGRGFALFLPLSPCKPEEAAKGARRLIRQRVSVPAGISVRRPMLSDGFALVSRPARAGALWGVRQRFPLPEDKRLSHDARVERARATAEHEETA